MHDSLYSSGIKALYFINSLFSSSVSNVGLDDSIACLTEGEITNVAVLQVQRYHGVGGLLLDELLRIAGQKGIAKIVLEVRASNDSAIRLYERKGFQKVGVRKGFYEFPKEDADIMIYGQ